MLDDAKRDAAKTLDCFVATPASVALDFSAMEGGASSRVFNRVTGAEFLPIAALDYSVLDPAETGCARAPAPTVHSPVALPETAALGWSVARALAATGGAGPRAACSSRSVGGTTNAARVGASRINVAVFRVERFAVPTLTAARALSVASTTVDGDASSAADPASKPWPSLRTTGHGRWWKSPSTVYTPHSLHFREVSCWQETFPTASCLQPLRVLHIPYTSTFEKSPSQTQATSWSNYIK